MADERRQTRIELMMREGDPLTCDFSDEKGRLFKVRRAVMVDGLLESVEYLNWLTGEWINPCDVDGIPDECFLGEELSGQINESIEAYDAETRAGR